MLHSSQRIAYMLSGLPDEPASLLPSPVATEAGVLVTAAKYANFWVEFGGFLPARADASKPARMRRQNRQVAQLEGLAILIDTSDDFTSRLRMSKCVAGAPASNSPRPRGADH
jgi:hypothetical protein